MKNTKFIVERAYTTAMSLQMAQKHSAGYYSETRLTATVFSEDDHSLANAKDFSYASHVFICYISKLKTREEREEEGSEEAAGSVERKTLTRKGGYLKYWNNDWKEKRAGIYVRMKKCRHIVPTGKKVESK